MSTSNVGCLKLKRLVSLAEPLQSLPGRIITPWQWLHRWGSGSSPWCRWSSDSSVLEQSPAGPAAPHAPPGSKSCQKSGFREAHSNSALFWCSLSVSWCDVDSVHHSLDGFCDLARSDSMLLKLGPDRRMGDELLQRPRLYFSPNIEPVFDRPKGNLLNQTCASVPQTFARTSGTLLAGHGNLLPEPPLQEDTGQVYLSFSRTAKIFHKYLSTKVRGQVLTKDKPKTPPHKIAKKQNKTRK